MAGSNLRDGTRTEITELDSSFFAVEEGKEDMSKVTSVTDKYNLDITITLDYIPDEYDYNLILLDKHSRLLGVGKNNGYGGKSITLPKWSMQEDGYTLKVQTSDESGVVSEESYSLSFHENTLHMEYVKLRHNANFECVVQRKMWEKHRKGTEHETTLFKKSKYEERYMEQMDAVYDEGQEFYA